MSDMNDWQASQFRDECERMREAFEALERARQAGTPEKDIQTLAYECGLGQIYNGRKA